MAMTSDRKTIRVLVVDDSLVARELLQDLLKEGGFAVAGEAADGVEAVEEYHRLQPTVTIIDVKMPRMGGIEACRKILADDPEATVLVCSATDTDSLSAAATDAGACGFLQKPFLLEKVVEAIETALATQRRDPKRHRTAEESESHST